LRSLLARSAQVETNDFLGALPRVCAAGEEQAALGPATGRCGDTIGPYRLIRELGSGGMGAVWLAERTDGILNRPVALKLPHVAARHASLAERMAREREILAALAHPHIARLYDAGVTHDGQPYLALEFIEGVAIDEYCAAHQLDLPARLKLFLQIAGAVAYAHGKLIVHRDLKPANVLVTNAGEVRLLDFGIAKLLDVDRTNETLLTQLAGPAFTPDYASPEQIRGEPLGTASDIYSLGVMLFRLVTGERPYRLDRESRGALEDAVLNAEPVRPSERVPAQLRRAVQGDLDTIVLECLRKNPDERYATVNALADDVERYLAHRPVLAQPDSLWYRAGKFVRRNWLAVGAAAAVALAILIGAGIALWQARVARDEQHRAEEVKTVLAEIFRNADPAAGGSNDLSAVDLLNQAQARIERLPLGRAALRLELFGVVANSLINLEQYDKAQAVVDRMIAEATRAFGPKHIETLRARLQLTQIRRMQARTDGLADELAALVAQVRNDPAATPSDLVFALFNSAHVAIDESRYAAARVAAEEALSIATASLPSGDPYVIEGAELLSVVYQYDGTPEQALSAAQRTDRLLAAVRPGDPLWPHAVEAHYILGRALADAGHLQEGLTVIGRASAEASTLYGADSPMVAFSFADLAKNYALAGDLTQAVDHSTRALKLLSAQSEPGSYTHGAALAMHGGVLLEARRIEESLPYLTQGSAELEQALGADNERTLAARTNLALALAWSGRFSDATAQLAAILSKQTPPGRILSYQPHHALGVVRRLQGDFAAALHEHETSLSVVQPGARHDLHRARVRTEIGLDLIALGRNEEAADTLRSVIAASSQLFITANPTQSDALVGLGRAHLARGAAAEARTSLAQADKFWQEFDARNRWAAEAAFWLGRCDRALGRSAAAEHSLQRATAIFAASPLEADRKLAANSRD
jgi:serine/threonine-protein kinase